MTMVAANHYVLPQLPARPSTCWASDPAHREGLHASPWVAICNGFSLVTRNLQSTSQLTSVTCRDSASETNHVFHQFSCFFTFFCVFLTAMHCSSSFHCNRQAAIVPHSHSSHSMLHSIQLIDAVVVAGALSIH
jgi:hypothetical protein